MGATMISRAWRGATLFLTIPTVPFAIPPQAAAALPLFASGFSAFGALGWKRKKKSNWQLI